LKKGPQNIENKENLCKKIGFSFSKIRQPIQKKFLIFLKYISSQYASSKNECVKIFEVKIAKFGVGESKNRFFQCYFGFWRGP
jgi:hypothetical protein